MVSNHDKLFKILIIGDAATGKTALVQQYLTGQFSDNVRITIGVNFYTKRLEVAEGSFILQIWDLGGCERFRCLLSPYFLGTDAVLFLYDITNPSSLYDMEKWIQELRVVSSHAILLVIGAKKDLDPARKVQLAEGATYARRQGAAGTIEVSSKTGENVALAFETAINLLFAQHSSRNIILAPPAST